MFNKWKHCKNYTRWCILTFKRTLIITYDIMEEYQNTTMNFATNILLMIVIFPRFLYFPNKAYLTKKWTNIIKVQTYTWMKGYVFLMQHCATMIKGILPARILVFMQNNLRKTAKKIKC